MRRGQIKLTSGNVLTFIIVAYAVVISLFVDDFMRNYLVIFAGIFGGAAILGFRLPITRQLRLWMVLLVLMAASTLRVDPIGQLASPALTAVYAAGYFAIGGLLERVPDKREYIQGLLLKIIVAFAIVSVLQMATSFVGLPILNKMSTKGLWSYNSLAMEPSQLGRVVGITMLGYLIAVRPTGRPDSLWSVLRRERIVFLAFFVTMILSGSALAMMAVAAVLLLSRSLAWGGFILVIAIFVWPIAQSIDYEPLQRAVSLMSSVDRLDVKTLAAADGSGASRIIPTLIYLQDANPGDPAFWFGYGVSGLEMFVSGRIPGFGDKIAAGFLPGYLIVYGAILAAAFFWIFIFRHTNNSTAPLILFWLFFISSSAFNTQVLWYGLIVIRIIYSLHRETVCHARRTVQQAVHGKHRQRRNALANTVA